MSIRHWSGAGRSEFVRIAGRPCDTIGLPEARFESRRLFQAEKAASGGNARE